MNKAKRIKRFFIITLYIVALLFITTPIVIFFGPYENTRKAFISTILATRHAYLITDIFGEDKINDMLGKYKQESEEIESSVQDLSKVEIEHSDDNEVNQYNIHSDRYEAHVLEIKNPLKVKVAMTSYLNKRGERTSEMARRNNAIAAINGGAFIDMSSDGTKYAGTGAVPGGFVISRGKLIYPPNGYDENYIENVIAFTKDGHLIVGDHTLKELLELNVQESVCFRKPNIIINGERQIKDKLEEGLNPRTAIGQKEDGTVIFLVIDGRKISMPGASVYDIQEIMMKCGAINAGALDGGYSSTMYYNGELINSPNAWDGERSVATVFYVEK